MPTEDYYRRSVEIGAALHSARTKRGLSMREVAAYAGMSRQRYALIETGKAFIAAVELESLARFLGIRPVEILPPDFVSEVMASTHEVVLESADGRMVRLRVGLVVEE